MTKRNDMPATAVYALTRQGAELGLRLAEGLSGTLFLPRRLTDEFGGRAEYFDSLAQALTNNFHRFRGQVVVGATGITVRLIAPLLVSKKEDPAVVTVTQDGRFVVSLLSGHLGGANELALKAAGLIGGQAVLSTATDLEGLPALEIVARDNDLVIENFAALPAISRLLVEGEKVEVYDPYDFLKPHLAPWSGAFTLLTEPPTADSGPVVTVDYLTSPGRPAQALIIRPKILALGLGCHRGIDFKEVEELALESLAAAAISPLSIACLATVETRSEEPAFLELSRRLARPLIIYTKEELSRVETPNPSGKVLAQIGVPSVCEAAAMLAAKTESLIISKRKSPRATLAAALIRS